MIKFVSCLNFVMNKDIFQMSLYKTVVVSKDKNMFQIINI